MLRKILLVGMVMSVVFLYGENNRNAQQNFIIITKKMIEGKVFYSRYDGNSFYIQSKFKNIDPADSFGEVVCTAMGSPKSISGSMDYVYYRLKNGKIVISGNDGSATRLTLISASADRWILMKEEDVDGRDKRFGYKKSGKRIYYLKKPKGYPELEKCKPVDLECFVEAFKFPV